jgi:SAM-dependent methyltransferase
MWNSRSSQTDWSEPDKEVTGLLALLREEHVTRILDIGCGLGRHVFFFAAEGFEVTAYDSSLTGVEYCLKCLQMQHLTACVTLADSTLLSKYPDGHFDFVLCWNVIYHATLPKMEKELESIRRITRDRGLLYITFNSTQNKNYGVGNEIEPCTYDNPRRDRGHHLHHYSDETEVRSLLAGWHLEKLMHQEEKIGPTTYPGSWHWMALARKARPDAKDQQRTGRTGL